MKPISAIKILAAVFSAYWLSNWAYFPPLAPEPNVSGLLAGFPQEAIDNFCDEIRVINAKGIAVILVGFISGGLLYLERRSGYFLVLGVSAFFLIIRLYGWFSRPAPLDRFIIFASHFPIQTVHNEILGNLLLVVTIIFLTRKSIRQEFGTRRI